MVVFGYHPRFVPILKLKGARNLKLNFLKQIDEQRKNFILKPSNINTYKTKFFEHF